MAACGVGLCLLHVCVASMLGRMYQAKSRRLAIVQAEARAATEQAAAAAHEL